MTAYLPLGRPTLASMRGLDRCAERRADKDWIAARLADPSSRVMALVDLQLALTADPRQGPAGINWHGLSVLQALKDEPVAPILLGCEMAGAARFAVALNADDARRMTQAAGCDLGHLAELRALAVHGSLDPHELAVAGEARALAAWHHNHRCCGRCGARTKPRDAGWRRQCWACGASAFPRSDPAVIVLITHGNRALLAHHKRFAEPRYTVLAGFVEPGEDIEDCVRREVREESGIEVGEVRYLGSQPWPFPHNLMIGCWGEARSTDFALDADELTDAVWVTREEAKSILDGCHPKGWVGPGPFSIACMLIRSFIEGADR